MHRPGISSDVCSQTSKVLPSFRLDDINGCVEEFADHVVFIVTGNAASDFGEEELEVGVCPGAFVEKFNAVVDLLIGAQSKIFIQRGEGVTLTSEAFTNTHLSTEAHICLPGSPAIVFSRHVRSKHKYLVWIKCGYHGALTDSLNILSEKEQEQYKELEFFQLKV